MTGSAPGGPAEVGSPNFVVICNICLPESLAPNYIVEWVNNAVAVEIAGKNVSNLVVEAQRGP